MRRALCPTGEAPRANRYRHRDHGFGVIFRYGPIGEFLAKPPQTERMERDCDAFGPAGTASASGSSRITLHSGPSPANTALFRGSRLANFTTLPGTVLQTDRITGDTDILAARVNYARY